MIRLVAALAIALTALQMSATASWAAQLVYVQWDKCGYCLRFNREMAGAYAASAAGRKFPLRWVDVLGGWPADLKHVSRPSYTPVFILVENGREIGRFDGYAGPQTFKRNLQSLLQKRR